MLETDLALLGLFSDWTPQVGSLANLLARGSFTLTGTGFIANPSGPCLWQRVGNMAILVTPSLAGTSNATTMTLTGLPAALTPTQDVSLPARIQSGGVDLGGLVTLSSGSGTITVYASLAAAAFSAVLGKALYPSTLIYPIG